MAKIGSIDWFLEGWNERYKEEMAQYDESSKEEELEFCHTVYSHVKDSCRVGILHRKSERLQIKDELIELFTKAALQGVDYFIENNRNFPEDGWANLKNVKSMLANSGADRLFQEQNEQYLNAVSTLLNILLDAKIIHRVKSNTERKEALLEEILEEGGDAILTIAETMSAHLCFRQPFPENWLEFDQLDSENSENPILDGRLYEPSTFHCWLVNLSWMMAHLHKGNEFIIFSEMTDENLKRKTKGHEGEFSGFAREITLAKKMGYHIEIENDTVFMRATEAVKHQCKALNFEDARMNGNEIVEIYNGISQEINSMHQTKNITIDPTSASQESQNMENKVEVKKRRRDEFFSQSSETPPKKRKEKEVEQPDTTPPPSPRQ